MLLRVLQPMLVSLVEYLFQGVASPFLLHCLHPQVVYSHIFLVFGLTGLVFNSLSQFYLICLRFNQIQSLYRSWLRSIKLLLAVLGLPPYPKHNSSLLGGMLDLTSSLALAHPLQIKELFYYICIHKFT